MGFIYIYNLHIHTISWNEVISMGSIYIYIWTIMINYIYIYEFQCFTIQTWKTMVVWGYSTGQWLGRWENDRSMEVDFSLPCLRTPEGIANPQKAADKYNISQKLVVVCFSYIFEGCYNQECQETQKVISPKWWKMMIFPAKLHLVRWFFSHAWLLEGNKFIQVCLWRSLLTISISTISPSDCFNYSKILCNLKSETHHVGLLRSPKYGLGHQEAPIYPPLQKHRCPIPTGWLTTSGFLPFNNKEVYTLDDTW